MPAGKKIVVYDDLEPRIQKEIENNLPDGFILRFVSPKSGESALAEVADADYMVVWAGYVPANVVSAGKRLRLIQKIGEGTDRIDVATARSMGIPVAKTTGSNGASVADFATLLMLSTIRWLPRAHNSMMDGEWLKFELRWGAYDMLGKQVGIVGMGKIGRRVARRVQGFESTVVYHDAIRLPESEEERLDVRYMPLDELMATSDIISLHVPLNSSTEGMIGRKQIGLMKLTAILVNTCRGAVVDEQALYEALRDKRIRGAGLDCFVKEPLPAGHPFRTLDNVVLTPHCAGGTEDSGLEGIKKAYSNILRLDADMSIDPADLV